jgi:DNA-binding LytR/AlgR family response regulator
MNVVVIEDEKLVSDDLSDILQNLDHEIVISKTISSVKEAMQYFKSHESPQLIFSDIQLGDGYSFEIFKELQTSTPVIYCTAFNQHALQAFENNGIAYVLKPYTKNTIKQALDKYQLLKQAFGGAQKINYDDLLAAITGNTPRPASLLVNYKNKIIPVKIHDVAFFISEHKTTSLVTLQNKKYALNYSLDELAAFLFQFIQRIVQNKKYALNYSLDELEQKCGLDFFRANRQFLINKSAVKEVMHYSFRKLFVSLAVETGHEIIINKTKSTEFLNWLKS